MMQEDKMTIKEIIEIRKEEMKSMLPNMQTIMRFGKEKVVIHGLRADEIVQRGTKG